MREMTDIAKAATTKGLALANVQLKSCCSVSLILYTLLLLIFSTCLAVGTSVGLARQVGRTVIDHVVFRLMQEINGNAGQNARTLLKTAEDAVASYARRLSYDETSWNDEDYHQRMLYDLQASHNFTYPNVFFADTKDHFWALENRDDGIWFEYPNAYGTTRVLKDPNCTVVGVKLTSVNDRVAGTTDCMMKNYYPSKRPWWILIDSARATAPKDRVVWTPFYVYHLKEGDSGTLGITVAQGVWSRSGTFVGVVAVDLTIRELNKYLTTLPTAATTRVVIVDDGEMMVAASSDTGLPGGAPIQYKDSTGAILRHHMRDYGDPGVQTMYQMYGDNFAGSYILEKKELETIYGISKWMYVGTDVVKPHGDGLRWTFVALIPESEAAGDLDDPGKITGGCAGIVIAVVLVTSGLVVWLVYPISRFAKDMEGLAQGTLRPQDFYQTRLSVVSEVGRMQKALAQIASANKGGYEVEPSGAAETQM